MNAMFQCFRCFGTLFLLWLCFFSLRSPASAAPPDSWHHQKVSLTGLTSGWSSNRHFSQPPADPKNPPTDGCGLVHFDLPPFFSTSAFDRNKVRIRLSLTTYVPGDFIHPPSNLEISSIDPEAALTLGEKNILTLEAGTYRRDFHVIAQPPGTWIAPLSQEELAEMLSAFAVTHKGRLSFASGEKSFLKFGHLKPVLEDFRLCLAQTHFAVLPPL